jgi:HEAT repeat protein
MFFRPSSITLDAAIRDLGSKDARVRVAAAHALGDLPAGPDAERAAAALRGVLGDPRYEVRCTASLSLGELGDREAVPALLALVDDPHREVRQTAIIALGRLRDPRALAPLLTALADGPPDVRFQAARTLAEIDPAAAYEPLVRALADGDAEVRESVCEALAVVGDRRCAGWVAELLADPRPGTRFAAASTLAGFADARGLDVLVAALGERERAWEAMEGLETIGDARAVEPLLAQLRRRFLTPVLRVRAAAALTMLVPDGPAGAEARAYLEKCRRSRREEVRGYAVEALERLGAGAAAGPGATP